MKPRKFRIKDTPLLNSIANNSEKGDLVYECTKVDYGAAESDSYYTGQKHMSVTLEEDGGYPFFTIPIHNLEELPD